MLLDNTRPFTRKASRIFVAALLLIGVPTLLVIAATHPTQGDQRTGAEKAAEDWMRFEDGKTILTFRGEIVDADGKPAVNPQVRSKNAVNLKVTGNEFECDVVLENQPMASLNIIAESEDKKLVAIFSLFPHDMRVDASKFHQITLKPTTSFDFRVLHKGKPVSGANVQATTGGWNFTTRGVTNTVGIATLNFPSDSVLDYVLAWNEKKMIGGYSFDRDPVRDPKLPLHEIELSNCIDQKIRLIDSATGKPLAGFKFDSFVATKPGYNFLQREDVEGMGTLVTNENGEAIDQWFPDWDSFHFYPELDREIRFEQGWSKAGDGKPKMINGVLVFEYKHPEDFRRLPVRGQVNFPDGFKGNRGGLEVELSSFQSPAKNYGDTVRCQTDLNGNFTAEVLSGATYRIDVNDAEWVSESRAEILAGPNSKNDSPLKISVSIGEPVTVAVNVGPDEQPVANQTVCICSEFEFHWNEDGERRSGTDNLQKWAVTDENGIARIKAAPGDYSVFIFNPDWRPSQKFEIRKGEPTSIQLHRKSSGKRLIRGQLYLASGQAKDLSGTVVKLKSIDGETRAEETVTTNEAGEFSCEMAGSRIGGYARTADGKLNALFFTSDFEEIKKATLVPGVQYRGKVVDADDKPIKGLGLQLKVVLQEEEIDPSTTLVRTQFDIETLLATTDEDGVFEFLAPPGMPCRLYYQEPTATNSDKLSYEGTRFFTPEEDRPLEIIKVGKSPTRKYSAKETVARKARDCRLNHMRQLFVLEGTGDSVSEFLKPVLREDGKKNRSLYWYGITRIKSHKWSDPESKKFWESYVSQLPAENEVIFLVLGNNAEELGRITVNALEADSAAMVAKFIEANRIADIDAQKTLDDALILAKSSDRKVWLQFSQTRCGPCFRLSRWIDKHKKVLDKAYVFIKVDDIRNKNGRKLWKKYVGKRSMGIPFSVVLDAEGVTLEESLDNQGSNIGFPSTFEDSLGFRRIFNATAKERLSPEEIDALVKSIN